MSAPKQFCDDNLKQDALALFREMVESVGTKRFSVSIGIGTRQVNRILAGAQPNPIERLVRCLQSVDAVVGDRVLDFVCQEMGGHFVRMETLDAAQMNAVKECAEAIAAISDGQISEFDIREIREAISALAAISISLRDRRNDQRP